MMIFLRYWLLAICIVFVALPLQSRNLRENRVFNNDWQFCNQEDLAAGEKIAPYESGFSFAGWKTVTLPHTAKEEPLVVIHPWQGVSWYKKDFIAYREWQGKRISIEFGAVMQQAEIWFNGRLVASHAGGYLPFTIDITDRLVFGKTNRLVVRADNGDNAQIPPGKPIDQLDFCYYSGIYRDVWLHVTSPLHITDPVAADKPASGGVRVWFPRVSASASEVAVATHIKNESSAVSTFRLVCAMIDKTGKVVASVTSALQHLAPGADTEIRRLMQVAGAKLWHPGHPYLYTLRVTVEQGGMAVDQVETRIGIRSIQLSGGQLLINGQPYLLSGTNRHQEYPYIGNALSANAQYRDAVKIREAGFNIVRLSHYPQSPAFMDACDELGLLTIAAIPGWQFVGDSLFMQRSYQDARDLIRRDRNHPCVAMWELSLNESPMPDNYMRQMVAIAGQESPESKLITCGWINKYYDVFTPARQHARLPDYWKKYDGATPLFTAEYGDWEYFAQDAGLNQAGYAGLKSDERTSRQLRGDGEKRLLQQALNFQEAHNDNLRNPHLGDANWLMFDYNRGYSPDIESSGIMDIFRLPKFAWYLYRSQQLPTLKIATWWNNASPAGVVLVYSDCDEVALYLNNRLIGREKAVPDNLSDHLPHPPYRFVVQTFEPGRLKAIGYKNGKAVLTDAVCTAGVPARLVLSIDESGRPLKAGGADVVFVHATVCDADGNPVRDAKTPVTFSVTGNARIIGQNPVDAESGTATVLLQSGTVAGQTIVGAAAKGLTPANASIRITK
jgi:beta-galactosidase